MESIGLLYKDTKNQRCFICIIVCKMEKKIKVLVKLACKFSQNGAV